MRLVPQPVTVITSANTSTHPSGSPSSWHGATISSFNTVTLKPIPIISFNIKHDSSTFAAITASGRLWVHLLTTAPFASTLADGFARQRGALHPSLIAEITEGGHEHDLSGQQPPTEPIIPPGGRIAFILACHYMPDITARIGDHVVLFAEVTEVIDQSPRMVSEGRKPSKRRPCLVYADGEYQRLTPLDDPSYHNDTNDKS
jgi:flavin reductase (DIM6/NTAB) family NADH-FMN oxidoreductase RutF